MSVKLIAENILEADDFLSATEQEGEHVGQPVPTSSNTGDFRLLSKGTIADFTYSGTATGDGSTTTIVDSVLAAFGDDYFIGGVITFLAGENTSGTATVTDFAQATGTLTWAGAVNSTLTGDTFTLTLAFASRDFRVELIAGGDAGAATFKWSHDGGSTYFGRNDPDQATWLAQSEIDTDVKYTALGSVIILQMTNGSLLCVFNSNADETVQCRISSDGGITWGARIQITSSTGVVYNALVLRSGRIIVTASGVRYISDDDGATWNRYSAISTSTKGSMIELKNGNLIESLAGSSQYVRISKDGGATWGDNITVSAAGVVIPYGVLVEMDNGNVLCVYATDEDSAGDIEIKGRISEDGGATWGSNIDIIDFVANDLMYPCVAKDIDGKIFVAAAEQFADEDIVYSTSSDNGATWGAKTALATAGGGDDYRYPHLVSAGGHEMVCVFLENTSNDLQLVRRGMWEAYSANACPCAPDAAAQALACGAEIVWHGGAGDAGDDWQFEAEYDYAMANLIEDSPQKCWRSEQDGIACSIVIDMGGNDNFFADGVAFFGCNVRTLSFQMNATDSWSSPSVDESVSFDIATGIIDATSLNYLQDTSLLANYKDHELSGSFMRLTSGVLDTYTFTISDNVGDYLVFSDMGAAASGLLAPSDTFAIYKPSVAATFTAGVHRFMRILVDAQRSPIADGYYQIGAMVAGRAITLTDSWQIGYTKTNKYGVTMLRPPSGGMIPIKDAERKRVFDLDWKASEDGRGEVIALVDYLDGKNIALIPDSDDLGDCYLVKSTADIRQEHWLEDRFNFTITLEENL